jgi:hypothetical protein
MALLAACVSHTADVFLPYIPQMLDRFSVLVSPFLLFMPYNRTITGKVAVFLLKI